MWRLWNKLFGWDYVQWHNTCDQGVARVHVDGTGRLYYWRYSGLIGIADVIKPVESVLWLTCPPTKYMQPNDQI